MESSGVYETINTIKRMMKITGSWPQRSPTPFYKFRRFTSMLLLFALICTTLAQVLNNFKDIHSVSFGLSVSTAASQAFLRHVLFFPKSSNFWNILDCLTQFKLKERENNLNIYLQRKIRMCNVLRNILFSSSMATIVTVGLAPVFSLKSNRILPIPFPADMNQFSAITYGVIWMFQTVAAGIICWSLPCFDSLIFTFMWISVAQTEILQEKIKFLNEVIRSKRSDMNAAVTHILKHCAAYHVAIERYIQQVEETFTLTLLVQLLASIIITCLVGFNSILEPVTSVQFGRSFCFFIAIMMEFALFCIPANELTIQSTKISDSCYETAWNNCNPAVRKVVFIMMERSKRPFVITAGKFVTLSLQSLISVWKSAFSYFTVLWRLYAELK